MRISLSKKSDPRDRHAVLTAEPREVFDARAVIGTEILGDKFRPHTEPIGNGGCLWRFHMRFLETLVLAFPYAELSPGVHKRFRKAEEKRLDNYRIPELKIPGYTGELYNFQKVAVALLTDPDYAKEHGHNGVKPGPVFGLEHSGGVVDFENDEMGLGKGYTLEMNVLTPNGWKKMGEIAVGDKVIGKNGRPTNVLGVYPQPVQQIYRVTFSDGTWVRTDGPHLWEVSDLNGRKFVLSTEQMFKGQDVQTQKPMPKGGERSYTTNAGIKLPNGNRKWRIPMVDPVQFPKQNLPVDPYLLGLLLGDGGFSNGTVSFSTADVELSNAIKKFLPAGNRIHKRKNQSYDYTITGEKGSNPLRSTLLRLNLLYRKSAEKFVPPAYLRGLPKDRLAMLQGLMDSDGYAHPDGGAEFSSTSINLVLAVVEIVQSLGGVARWNEDGRHTTYTHKGEARIGQKSWRVNLKLPAPWVPFRLARKVNQYVVPTKYQPTRLIESIEPDRFEETVCIKVDAEDSLFVTKDYIVTHNTFVALAAIAVLQAYPALVAVPNNAKYTWAEVIEEFYPKLSYAVYDAQEQSPAERAMLIRERRDITIVNMEALRARPVHQNGNKYAPIIGFEYANPDLFDFTYEYAVLDEHHRVKNPNAQVTYGFFQLDAEDWWAPMSGTPVLNRPEEIWTVLHKLYPTLFPSYDEFVQKLCIFGNNENVVAYRTQAMKELRAFLADRSIRRRADQVIKNRPEVTTKPVLVTLSKEERKIYDRIEEEMEMEMANGTIKNIGDARVQVLRLKQACFSPVLFGGKETSSKVDELKTIVAELVASGEKAIIFSQWKKAARMIEDGLKQYNPAYVDGTVKNRNRQEQKRRFMEDDDCHIYIGTIDANREAINLGIATYVIFTDEGWVPAAHDQAIGRSAAGGLRGAHLPKGTVVTVIILRAEDSYEQYVESMLRKKKAIVNRVTERDAGKSEKIEKVSLNDLREALSRNRKKKAA